MKRNTIALAGAFSLAAFLSACGTTSTTTATAPASTAPPTTAAPAPVAAVSSPDSFLSDLAGSDLSDLAAGDPSGMVTLGQDVCSAFNDGDSASFVTTNMLSAIESTDNDLTSYQGGEIIGYAVADLCPAYVPVLQAFIDANS